MGKTHEEETDIVLDNQEVIEGTLQGGANRWTAITTTTARLAFMAESWLVRK